MVSCCDIVARLLRPGDCIGLSGPWASDALPRVNVHTHNTCIMSMYDNVCRYLGHKMHVNNVL